MEEFTRWCLTCACKLQNEAVYCSTACLTQDAFPEPRSKPNPAFIQTCHLNKTPCLHLHRATRRQDSLSLALYSLPDRDFSKHECSKVDLVHSGFDHPTEHLFNHEPEFEKRDSSAHLEQHQQHQQHQHHDTTLPSQSAVLVASIGDNTAVPLSQTILTPPFSLQFKSRRRITSLCLSQIQDCGWRTCSSV
ncbi:hypothetical protein BJ741DRAFT_616427 [Chytriomyces cf. hyalinus JEL632]|nr:hypothetical protein BJ741DRAFT_616427 [Chytriomyces cf. hyalinus JEL632]